MKSGCRGPEGVEHVPQGREGQHTGRATLDPTGPVAVAVTCRTAPPGRCRAEPPTCGGWAQVAGLAAGLGVRGVPGAGARHLHRRARSPAQSVLCCRPTEEPATGSLLAHARLPLPHGGGGAPQPRSQVRRCRRLVLLRARLACQPSGCPRCGRLDSRRQQGPQRPVWVRR